MVKEIILYYDARSKNIKKAIYNLIQGSVRVTTVTVEKQYFLFIMFVCLYCCLSLSGMQSALAASYCHLWPVLRYRFLPHYLINGMIFGKHLIKVKFISSFCTNLPETFLILRKIYRDIMTHVHRAVSDVTVILVRL